MPIALQRRPVAAETDPRRERKHPGQVLRQRQRLDLRVRVREVQQGREREVPARRVAADHDLGRGARRQDVPQGFGGLPQLRRVGGGRRERVGEEEERDVVPVAVERAEQLVQELEVPGAGGECEPAASGGG